jgi:hypothetical protein
MFHSPELWWVTLRWAISDKQVFIGWCSFAVEGFWTLRDNNNDCVCVRLYILG